MIKGIDVGYTYTKDESNTIFRSAFSRINNLLNDSMKLTVDGATYYMGQGVYSLDENRTNSEIVRLCILTCLAKSDGTDFQIVSGLPIGQYKAQKEQLARTIYSLDKSCVSLDDAPGKRIRVTDVEIFPQGAAALFSQNILGDALFVDIGGRTVDVAFIEISDNKPQVLKHDTLFCGMLGLYAKIISEVNSRFNLSLEARYAQKILDSGLTIHGVRTDVSFLVPLMQDYFAELFEQIKLNYPAATTPIYLCGGGAEILHKAFKRRFPAVSVLSNPQFSNARGFYNIGCKKFTERRLHLNANA